jgi:phosphoglycolate phosphatase
VKLILFDIDGTILKTHGVGREAVEYVMHSLLGAPASSDGVAFSGKTDPQIFREVLLLNGIPHDEADTILPEALRLYSERMEETLDPDRVDLLPGLDTIVPTLADRDDVRLGLLTGNLEPMAYLKLDAVGLADHFSFGAFGSDHERRDRLPPIAVGRALDRYGHRFSGRDIVIVGDTEHDITCGREMGVFAVAVCTGRYSREDLAAHGADVVFDDLSDTGAFFELLS